MLVGLSGHAARSVPIQHVARTSAALLPRQVLPRQFYLVTRRCTQRQFLLRPDRETNNAFTYALIEAAQRAHIDVLLPCAMSNHYMR